ncbi:beta-agarase [Candidatus Poribacteria bacterium]|nr:beta-agarase [Candidatus Poribacteria bacterium]
MLSALIALALQMSTRTSPYGGWSEKSGESTGFFRVQRIDGIWWLIDPDGNAFLSKGVNHISYAGDRSPALGRSPYGDVVRAKYPDEPAWARACVERLRGWGFNTVGAWSSRSTFAQGMPYTLIVNIGSIAGGDWQTGSFPDVFSGRFRSEADRVARLECAPLRDDPYLLGYFTDNELRWGPDWRSDQSLLEEFFAMPAGAEGKAEVVRLFRESYGSVERFNEVWGSHMSSFEDAGSVGTLSDVSAEMRAAQWALTRIAAKRSFRSDDILRYLGRVYPSVAALNERWGTDYKSFEAAIADESASPKAQELARLQSDWLRRVASQYFRVCAEAIREHDPNHLILGCRYAGYAPDEVVESMGENVDIVSYNNYDFLPPVEKLNRIHRATGRPMMLTEFSFKAMDSGLPNTRGAGRPVATQQERAERYDAYVTALLGLPFMVGFHWFEHADEPSEGRFDGENSNYGVVDIRDEPWTVLTSRMRVVNERLEERHAGAGR